MVPKGAPERVLLENKWSRQAVGKKLCNGSMQRHSLRKLAVRKEQQLPQFLQNCFPSVGPQKSQLTEICGTDGNFHALGRSRYVPVASADQQLRVWSAGTPSRERTAPQRSSCPRSVGQGPCPSHERGLNIGVLFGCFARKIDGPGLPGGLM